MDLGMKMFLKAAGLDPTELEKVANQYGAIVREALERLKRVERNQVRIMQHFKLEDDNVNTLAGQGSDGHRELDGTRDQGGSGAGGANGTSRSGVVAGPCGSSGNDLARDRPE